MKKLTFSKIGCGVMIGLLAPIGAGYAADANDYIQTNLGGDSPSLTSNYDAWSKAQGAQGPIRSDMTEDKLSESERAARKMDMEKQLHPFGGNDGA